MQLSLDNVISRRRYIEPEGWQDWSGELTPAQRDSLLALFGKGAHRPTVARLRRCFHDNCRRVRCDGIMQRVHLTDDGASYCAGQDYPSEVALVRRLLVASY